MRRWSTREIETLVRFSELGRSHKDASIELCRSHNAVKHKCSSLKIHFSGNTGAPRVISWERVRELAQSGYWMAKAAREMGIHHTTAMNIGRSLGFSWPPAPPSSFIPRCSNSNPRNRNNRILEVSKENPARVDRMLRLAGCA